MNQKLIEGGHTSHLPLHTSNRGITLIALVITIIVLLILAGVTINMVLGDDGIIANAQKAKEENNDASLKEAASIAKGEAVLNHNIGQTAMKFEDLVEEGFNFTEEADYHNSVAKVTEDGVPIPVGFAHVQGTTKEEGLVVVDRYGNEYVWVPVDNTELPMFEYDETTGNYEGILYDWENWTGEGTPEVLKDDSLNRWDTNHKEPYSTNEITSGMQEEYNRMAKSVEIYGGFYVGRYITSWTGSRVASVANVEPINGGYNIETDGSETTWYTLYKEQRKLHENSKGVESGMIYGSQWDAIMKWMKDVPNITNKDNLYIQDGSDMGPVAEKIYCPETEYGDNHKECPRPECEDGFWLVYPLTGTDSRHSVKNIYDLVSYYGQLTQEAYRFGRRR